MKYAILIEPENTDPIALDSEVVRSVNYCAGEANNECVGRYVRNIHMTVDGVITSHENETLEMLRWLLVIGNDPFQCNIEVSVMSDDGELIRKITFPDAELDEYRETFTAEGARFTFRIDQYNGANEDIVIE